MRKLFILFLLILSIVYLGCEKTNDKTIVSNNHNSKLKILKSSKTKKIEEENAKLDILARNLVFALKNEAVLSKLNAKIFNADNKEKILDLERWLKLKVNGKSIAHIMAGSGNIENINGSEKLINAEDFLNLAESIKPHVDMYFPAEGHRMGWYEKRNELLVAYANPSDEWAPVTAYNLKGEIKILNTDKPPKEPVLMLVRCEHLNGVHMGNMNSIEAMLPDDDNNGGGGSGGGGGSSCEGIGDGCNEPRQDGARMILYKLRQKSGKCQEPWTLGDPEIHYSIKSSNSEYSKENIPFGDDTWDCTYHWDGIHHDYSWKKVKRYDGYWHWNDYGNYMVYFFYEDDDGILYESSDSYKVTITDKLDDGTTYTYTVTFGYGDEDDKMGSENVHKNDPYQEPGKDEPYDTGYIKFYVDWVNPD